MGFSSLKIIAIVFLIVTSFLFLKLSSLKVQGKNLITLRTRVFFALMLPLLILAIIFFASLLLALILGILAIAFILFLIFLITGKTKRYYRKF